MTPTLENKGMFAVLETILLTDVRVCVGTSVVLILPPTTLGARNNHISIRCSSASLMM